MHAAPADTSTILNRVMTMPELSRGLLLKTSRRTGFALFAGRPKTCSPRRNRNLMLSREDFVFTIGYDGPVAVIDGQARRRYGSLSTKALAEKGLFRAAYSSAIFSKDPEELSLVADAYNKFTGTTINPATLDRLFGVFPVEVKRSLVL